MNLCFFNDSLGVGGPEIWAVDVARRLSDRGHTVVMGCPSGSWIERESESVGLPLFDYPVEPEFEHNLRWQLAEALVDYNVDVVCCGIPGSRPEAPILHDAIQEAGRGSILLRLGVAPGEGALTPQQIGLGIPSVRGILAVSSDIRARLITQHPGFGADRIYVHYNGVDLDRFKSPAASVDRNRIRSRLGLPLDRLIVAAVGRLDRVKNQAALIQAAPRVIKEHPGVAFVIAGDGAEKSNLLQLAAQQGVSESIHFTGFVEDVPELLSAVDVLAHPSLSEGVPNAVIEAMATGLPVVASNVGGIPEVIDADKGTGILVPHDDQEQLLFALLRLVSNERERLEMGRRARTHVVESFDREACLDALERRLQETAELPSLDADDADMVTGPQVALKELPSLYYSSGCTLLNPASN